MTSSDNQHSVAAAGVQEQAAPGRLELVRRFVNTQDVEDGIEELGDSGGGARLAARARAARRAGPGRSPRWNG